MKKKLLTAALFVIVMLINTMAYSANEHFRSIASGNWNANATWEMSTNNGSTWFAASSTPRDTSGPITVRSPNTVTVTVSVTADQLTVNSGGTISINNLITLTIFAGSGDDLTINGTISGAGTVQSQGTNVFFAFSSTSNFTAGFRITSGINTSVMGGSPFVSIYKGPVTIDSGTTLTSTSGGYTIQANGSVTNNGKISGGTSWAFRMHGGTLTNNDTINSPNCSFDSTSSLGGTGVIKSATTITGTGNVTLSTDVNFAPTAFDIGGGGILNLNGKILTLRSGTFNAANTSTVQGSGTFRTQGTVNLEISGGANFISTLRVISGTTTSYAPGSPFTAIYKGVIIVDAGAILTMPAGGYFIQANNSVTNNGTITGAGGTTFRLRGSVLLTNNGVISPPNFAMDSTASLTGSGSYTSTNISIGSSGNVSLLNAITFSPGNNFTISAGGVLVPGEETYTFSSGTFVLSNGATVTGSGSSAGVLQTQGTVTFDFRSGAIFNSAVNVNTGTLTAFNSVSPFLAPINGPVTVDPGAIITTISGGYTTEMKDTVINNGTITSGSSATIRLKGARVVNNGVINPVTLVFDSTISLSGTGSFTGTNISIGSSGNVSLLNTVTFSPTNNFTVTSGGILNPNSQNCNFNSGTFIVTGGGTVSASGTFQTQGAVSVILRNNSNFNAPFRVNTGSTNAHNDGGPFIAIFNGTITVDPGSTLHLNNGGYTLRANNNLTNNGNITGSGTANFSMKGSTMVNNGSISPINFTFDSTTSLSGTGTFTGPNVRVGSSGNVSLTSNMTFSPTTEFDVSGILNPNTRTLTHASGTFRLNAFATVVNSGIFQTQNTVNVVVRNNGIFNAPLKVNTGTTQTINDQGPFVSVYNNTITVDAGATMLIGNSTYTLRSNGSVVNNGAITGISATFRFLGPSFTNNGSVSPTNFLFDTSSHSFQGLGSWSTTASIVSGSTVNLVGNTQLRDVNVNSGGTFNLSTFKLLVSGSNPIVNNGTLSSSSSAIEYNGTLNQSISTTNVTYNRLRINNSTGTTLPAAINVADTLSVVLGFLNLNGNIITISPTGYLSETPGNTVRGTSGSITTTRTLNAPSALNVAGFGAVLTTAVNLGSTVITRGHTVQSGLGGKTSISRYFDITPTTNTGLNATLVFKYDESELNGWSETFLALFRSTNSGVSWTLRGGAPSAPNNQITLTAIDAFSRWSATSTVIAAQIKLLMQGFYNNTIDKLNMRDTARVYLRNIITPFAIIDSAKSIVDSVTFNGSFVFDNAPTGTYYLHLKHRNSLETWSDTGGVAYTQGLVLNYDFTTGLGKAFGGNMIQKGSRFCIYSGDVDQEGNVDVSDVLSVYNDGNNFLEGYVVTDVNGDRFVDVSDLLITYNNSINFVSKVVP